MTRHVRICPKCSEAKPSSEYSTFKNGKPQGRCLACRREYDRAWRERNRERVRGYDRRYRESLRTDPERASDVRARNVEACKRYRKTEKGQAASARYRKRLRNDPVRWAAYMEAKRLAYHLRRERAGGRRNRLSPDRVVMPAVLQERLPVEPFRAWVEAKVLEYGSLGSLVSACSFGNHETVARGLYRVRYGNKHVALDFADMCLTNEGSTLLWELWPELG